jgi:hypothetical protein
MPRRAVDGQNPAILTSTTKTAMLLKPAHALPDSTCRNIEEKISACADSIQE